MAPLIPDGLIVFPAIDLKNGQVVRLAEGDMDRATVYGDDPAAQAMIFADQGAQFLHVVDLDGAFAGASVNGDAACITQIRRRGCLISTSSSWNGDVRRAR